MNISRTTDTLLGIFAKTSRWPRFSEGEMEALRESSSKVTLSRTGLWCPELLALGCAAPRCSHQGAELQATTRRPLLCPQKQVNESLASSGLGCGIQECWVSGLRNAGKLRFLSGMHFESWNEGAALRA